MGAYVGRIGSYHALVRLCHHRDGDLVGLGAAGKKIYFSVRTSAGFSDLVCGSA